MSHSRALGQHSVTRTKNFLSRPHPAPAHIPLWVPATRAGYPAPCRTLMSTVISAVISAFSVSCVYGMCLENKKLQRKVARLWQNNA